MAACQPAEDAIFVLQAHEVNVVDIQKVGGAVIRVNIFLSQLKPNAGRIGVTSLDIIDRQGNAGCLTILGGDGLTQVGSKCGDATLARQVVADECHAVNR
ncbi:MAG: hypothetical protein A2043_01480 [Candidatus Schekmanbacteria bacterium GWA2_38_9]|nr:MAG: hypothetical protein A2043_01480 [Candidatus Schekmanbacteria bacterium GWA2_38_9]